LTVREVRPNTFPLLSAVGRGQLRLELPADLPLDVNFNGVQGSFSLNMSGLALERLNMDAQNGSVLVTLPEYDPRGRCRSTIHAVRRMMPHSVHW